MDDSDLDLLRRCADGADRGALDLLFARHYPAVYRTALKLVRDEFLANDVAQATFLAAVRTGRPALSDRSFRAWLLAITVNEVRQQARRRRRRRDESLAEVCLVDPDGSAAEIAGRREFERALDDELRHLPPRLAEPLVLHYYESLPFAEVAAILGLPKSTVQTRITQAVVRLRRAFRRSGRTALLPCLELPSLAAVPVPWIVLLAMNGKQLAIAAVGCLVLGLGWLATGLGRGGDPPPAPAAHERAAVGTVGADAAAPGAQAVDPVRASPPADGRAGEALVFGRVVDAGSGVPVAAASVTLFDYATQELESLTTDALGSYVFASTRGCADRFRLTIDKPGAGRLVVPDVRPAIEPRHDRLHAGLVLHGRVRLASGAALPPGGRILAVRLSFQTPDERDSVAALLHQAVPDGLRIDRETELAAADGAFCLRDLQAGRHALIVVVPGRQPRLCPTGSATDRHAGFAAATAAESPPIEIVLPAAGEVCVDVVEARGALPIRGASVTVGAEVSDAWLPLARAAAEPATPHRFRVPVDLDAHGRVESLEVCVAAPGFATTRRGIGGHADGTAFVVALGQQATVLGTVRDDRGAPIAAMSVLIRVAADARLAGSARTDAAGAFAIGGLSAADGPMALLCLQPGARRPWTTVPLQLVDGEVRRVDLRPGVGGACTGRVAMAGVPQRDAYVVVQGQNSDIDVRCDTDDDGRFAFHGLPPDTYEVFLNLAVAGRSRSATREVAIDTTPVHLEFDFAQRVTGTVRFEGVAPGASLPDGEVVARRLDAANASDRVDLDADGRFELWVTTAGMHEITFDAGIGWVTLDPPRVDLRQGTPPELTLRVLPDPCDATIELHLRDAVDGTGAAGYATCLHRNRRGATSFEDGVLLEEAAGIGLHRFTVRSHAHRPTVVEIEVLPGQKRVVRHVALARAFGVRVSRVRPGEAGHRAGLRAGDQILRYAAQEIRSAAQLVQCLAEATGSVTLVVRRDGLDVALCAAAGPLGIELENLP
ncbi:MAG: sigma-70 family RNA polymerase sigma factor [Planctomycetes bacterium]|nr:sigma-70 family RNA polymerase sigma factor [Planctomycetota bacterium]